MTQRPLLFFPKAGDATRTKKKPNFFGEKLHYPSTERQG